MAMSFICDVCGREVNGITIVNGMNFCAKCYQETFAYGNADKLLEENNRLKAELAELKQNAIVPKFKVGQEVWVIKRIKQEVANGKIIRKYSYFNGGTPENLRIGGSK